MSGIDDTTPHPVPLTAKSIAKAAKTAFEASQLVPSLERVRALHEIRKELENAKERILAVNTLDLEVCLCVI